jgi:hypothetical protein
MMLSAWVSAVHAGEAERGDEVDLISVCLQIEQRRRRGRVFGALVGARLAADFRFWHFSDLTVSQSEVCSSE